MTRTPLISTILLLTGLPIQAASTVYQNGELSIEAGGRVQIQYSDLSIDDNGLSEDDRELEVLRFRPELRIKFNPEWDIKLAYELAKDSESLKDAYLRYRGISWIDIKLGNEVVPFSRERMISSTKQHSVNRSITGEREFGVPARHTGLHFETDFDLPIKLYASLAKANLYGDLLTELQFISPWRKTDIESRLVDEGQIEVYRFEYDLLDGTRSREDNFKDRIGLTFGIAHFNWENKKDLIEIDNVSGDELSLAFQGYGLSIETQYQRIEAETPFIIDRLLFSEGKADIKQKSFEIGYQINSEWQVHAGTSSMSAATWNDDWKAKEFGVNYFIDGHAHKVQLAYRDETQREGRDVDLKGFYLLWQYDY